jgi:hypothetical protein
MKNIANFGNKSDNSTEGGNASDFTPWNNHGNNHHEGIRGLSGYHRQRDGQNNENAGNN